MSVEANPLSAPERPLVCSAKGCRAPAVHGLRWNNPRLHAPDRRKVWLACDTHRQSLADFLAARGFLRDIVTVEDLPSAVPPDADPER